MIIFLAISTGHIRATGDEPVRVTVRKVVGGVSQYIFVNKVYEAIVDLEDGTESAWPLVDSAVDSAGGCWQPDKDDKVRVFILVCLLAGCDFLPAISGLPSHKMWEAALKIVRAEGVFVKSIFVEKEGVWEVDIEDCVKLLTTIFFFKYERKLRRNGKSLGDILKTCEGSLSDYVNVVRFHFLKLGPSGATSTCPGLESMRLQSERANAVLGYWQDGSKETMPPRNFNGKGWGVDPKSAASSSEELASENCVMVAVRTLLRRCRQPRRRNLHATAIRRPLRATAGAAAKAGSAPWRADAEATADYDASPQSRPYRPVLRVPRLSVWRHVLSWRMWPQVPRQRIRLHLAVRTTRTTFRTRTRRGAGTMTGTMTGTMRILTARTSVISRGAG